MAPAGFNTPDGVVHVKGRGRAQAKDLIERANALGIDLSRIVTTSVGYLVPEELLASDVLGLSEEDQEFADGGQDTPDDQLQAFDPSAHTIAEVLEYLDGVDDTERQRVLDAEAEAEKPRKGITDLNTTGKDAE
jgi:hypothetical protein